MSRRHAVIGVALLAVLAPLVFAGAYRYGFAQDDWYRLEAASRSFGVTLTDLLSPGVEGRRPLESFYFWVALRTFGLNATPFHLFAAVLHVANVLCWFSILTRLVRPAWALVGTSLFAVHISDFTVLYWVACAPELWLTLSVLLMVLVSMGETRRGLWAAVFMVMALGAKETAVLSPLIVLGCTSVVVGWKEAARRSLPLAVIALAWFTFYALRKDGLVVPSYAIDVGAAGILERLSRYATWSLELARPIAFIDAPTTPARWLAAVAILGAVSVSLRHGRRGAQLVIAGALWFGAVVLPAVAISGHSHRYLLYLALPGMSLIWLPALEAAVEYVSRGDPGRKRALPIALACALVVVGSITVWRSEFGASDAARPWNRDHFVLRRSIAARRTLADLESRRAYLRDDTLIMFVSTDPGEGWWDHNFSSALANGAALRVSFGAPDLDVEFAEMDGSKRDVAEYAVVLGYIFGQDGTLRSVGEQGVAPDPQP